MVCSLNIKYSFHLFIILGYKSKKNTYDLLVYDLSKQSEGNNTDDEESIDHGEVYDSRALIRERQLSKILYSSSIEGQLAAMYVTHDRVAVVYRRLPIKTQSNNPFPVEHYFALFDHNLSRVMNDKALSPSIRWLTAVVPYGIKGDFLFCDPAGQQLLLYNALDGTMSRHFHIAPINACCLTDGRLVLWIQKAYPSAPIGKLHFISAPHLENSASVSSSMNLLKISKK